MENEIKLLCSEIKKNNWNWKINQKLLVLRVIYQVKNWKWIEYYRKISFFIKIRVLYSIIYIQGNDINNSPSIFTCSLPVSRKRHNVYRNVKRSLTSHYIWVLAKSTFLGKAYIYLGQLNELPVFYITCWKTFVCFSTLILFSNRSHITCNIISLFCGT